MSHGHSHSCGDEHEHDHVPDEMGIQYSLYQKIDMENLECLNESIEGSGKRVFKSWENRLNFDEYVESDVDEELLFNIPFTGNIKLKGIIIIGEDAESHPAKIKLYKNRPNMTFDQATAPPDQVFDLSKDVNGVIEYSTKIVTFSSIQHLSLHIPSNFGAENTRIYYIGLKGEFTPAHRHGVTICNYEALPSVHDHKVSDVSSARMIQ